MTIGFPLMFYCILHGHTSSQAAYFIYYTVLICVFQFGWAAVQVTHLALIPEIVCKDKDNVQLNSIRSVNPSEIKRGRQLLIWGEE